MTKERTKKLTELKKEALKNYESWGYKIEVFKDHELIESIEVNGMEKTIKLVKETITILDLH